MASNIQTGPFDQPDSDRTLAIEVEGRKFYVPRDLMSIYSPVFKAMLFGGFAESKKDVIELKEKKAEDIEELLRCLIPMPRQKDIDDKNLQLILDFSDEYQIEDLRRRAELFLNIKMNACCGKSDSKLLEILRLVSKYRMKDLLQECIKRCAMEIDIRKLQEESLSGDLPCEVIASLMVYGHSNCAYSVGRDGKQAHCYIHGMKKIKPCKVVEPEKDDRVREFLNRMRY